MVKNRFYLWFILFIAVTVQLFLFANKEVFHIDEIFSFALANGERGVYLYDVPEEIDNKLIDGAVFNNYLTQGNNSSFAKMWQNLRADNHMPLYFVLLRAVSLLFNPAVFDDIAGIIINVVVLVCLLYCFYRLALRVFDNDNMAALAGVGVFLFSYSVLSLEIYFRMYLLQMLLSLVLFAFGVCFLFNKEKAEKEKRYLFGIFGLSVLNILTHYYSIIFCFIFTGVSGCFLLFEKRYKTLILFLAVMLMSVAVAYGIYPAMLDVGMSGERGGQFFAALKDLRDNPATVLRERLPLFWDTVFGNVSVFVFCVLLFVCVFGCSGKILKKERGIVLFSGGIFLLYGVFISLVMPVMIGYQLRYFAPIMPLGCLLFLLISYLVTGFFSRNRKIFYLFLFFVILAEIIIAAFFRQGNTFYFRATENAKKLDNLVKDADVWWGLGGGWEHAWAIHLYADKLANSNRVWMLSDFSNEDFLRFAEREREEKRYAYLLLPKQQEALPAGGIEKINSTTGRQAYYLFTVKNNKMSAMALEMSVFLVCPF